VKQA